MEYQIKPSQRISSDILDDLASRFIINIPVEERSDLIRLCFQIELAYWFYIDFICKNQPGVTGCGNKVFALQLFQHIPFLREHALSVDKIFDDWRQYKLSVPTYGAIILSEDLKHVLLVQSFWAKSSWGFPKGKINENEPPVNCAIREVLEETGFNINDLIDPNEFIESVVSDQFTRLYIVPNVPLTTNFQPQTRNEIKSCEWFRLEFLPVTRYDTVSKQNLGINSNSFFMITPFMKRLKKWVNDKLRSKSANGSAAISGRQRHHSTGDLDNIKRGGKPTSSINLATSNNDKKQTSTNNGFVTKVFKNSKINQSFDGPTPSTSTPIIAPKEKEQKMIILSRSEPPKRKLFSNTIMIKEKENIEKFEQLQKKNCNFKLTSKKNIVKFPNENSLSMWKNFKFDVETIFPKNEINL